MTMSTSVFIPKPVAAERLFLHVLALLESDPNFVPNWTKPEGQRDPWGPDAPGPLVLNTACYEHEVKGEPMLNRKGEVMTNHKTGEPLLVKESNYSSILGQGLACIWKVEYGSDGPLIDEYAEEDDEPNPLDAWAVECWFDTTYSYNVDGANCGDLHAFLMREIGRWLAHEGCDEWYWYQGECTSTWRTPLEIGMSGDPDVGGRPFAIPALQP